MLIKRTIVEVDMAAYSTITSILEESLGADATLKVNENVQMILKKSLERVMDNEEGRILSTAGDGAILSFKSPVGAHKFLEFFHSEAKKLNSKKTEPTAMRVFRSGVAYGDVMMKFEGENVVEFAGTTISKAVRLEAAADLGGALIDANSYSRLPLVLKKQYGGPENIHGKRAERFIAYRCLFDDSAALKIKGLLLNPEDSIDYLPDSDTDLPSFNSSAPSDRHDLLDRMELLCDYEGLLNKFMSVLGIPFKERPARVLGCVEKCTKIFDWAEVRNMLNSLFQELQKMIIQNRIPVPDRLQ